MAQCLFPYSVERKLYFNQESRYVKVPCGKCPACLRRRLASWSFRLEVESFRWSKLMFVTFTYNPEHCPVTKNGFMTLRKEDVQLAFKRLRKKIGKFRYYLCGEYGTRNKRPHYHAIIYAHFPADEYDVLDAWKVDGKQIGECYFGKVEAGSIRYCVQYYDKGEWRPRHGRDDRIPEFSTMSNGIGQSFLTEEMVRHIKNNPEKPYLYNDQGHKIAIPRYYLKRIFDYVGTDALVAAHPSILLHRDEKIADKEERSVVTKFIMEQIPQPEETEELIENRRAAARNYRNSKLKTRKL